MISLAALLEQTHGKAALAAKSPNPADELFPCHRLI
jgi:hypothetical protein